VLLRNYSVTCPTFVDAYQFVDVADAAKTTTTEDPSVSAEVPSSLLNRSYDTAKAGRRTRSAAAAARRSRLRSAASTSSMPASNTATAADDQRPGVQYADGVQVNDAGDTSGLFTLLHL